MDPKRSLNSLNYLRLHQNLYLFTSFTERLDAKGQPKQDEAGVALALAKCGTSSAECFSQRVFAPGRVLRVAASSIGTYITTVFLQYS